MNRHDLRDRVFKLLFRIEFNSIEEMEEQIKLFSEDEENGTVDEKDTEYVTSKYEAVLANLEKIDELINSNSTGWDTKRLGKVELTILRLAIYEMSFDEDIPVGVAINEAVELAKSYGQENSGAYINAVLTKINENKSVKDS